MAKKLLIVLGSMGRGGAERVISLISNFFCEKGWEVYIVLLLYGKVEYVLNKGVTVIDLSGETQSRIRRLPGWIKGIRKNVREIKPNSILSFAARINLIVLIACFGLRQNVVVSERNDPFMDGRTKMIDVLTRLLYPCAKAVVFQTKRAARYFKNAKFKNTLIIPNPISVQCRAKSPVGCKIVTVGRLTKQKNQAMLIKAFSEINRRHKESILEIYGDGELKDELLHQINDLNLGDRVFLKGNVPNVHEMIADALFFVLSSDYEGLSNALLEAMMMGLPCVSTDCAGSDEYIIDRKSGLIVPVNDRYSLEKAMIEMIDNSELREICRRGAIQASIRVEAQTILNKWYKILM